MIDIKSTTPRLAAVALALVAVLVAGVAPAAAAPVHNATVASDVDRVEADVAIDSGATDGATVELSADGMIIDYQTLSSNGTAVLNASDVGAASLNVSSDDAANVSVEETRAIVTETVEISDATNESVSIALGLEDATSVAASIANESGSTIWSVTVDNSTDAISWSVGSTDGLETGNLTVSATVAPVDGLDAAAVSIGDGALLGAGIVEPDSSAGIVAVLAVLLIVALIGMGVGRNE